MANYSYNHIVVRGPIEHLAMLQSESFEPSMGGYGDEHGSGWCKSDGEDVLAYSGSSRRYPPRDDARGISTRFPECLVELSYIDEGFCYEGCASFQAGQMLFEDQCSEETMASIFEAPQDSSSDSFSLVAREHERFFKAQRSELGWRPGREASAEFKAFIHSLREDASLATTQAIGAKAKLSETAQIRLACLFDAPALLRAHAHAIDLKTTLAEKTTPFGPVEGMRVFLAFLAEGILEIGTSSCQRAGVDFYQTLMRRIGRHSAPDARIDSALSRLLSTPNADKLLFAELSKRSDFASEKASLGSLLAFGDGQWRYGEDSWVGRASARFAELGAASWIDASARAMAKEHPLTPAELAALPQNAPLFADAKSGYGLLNDAAQAIAPWLSAETLDELLRSDLAIGKARSAIEREALCRMASPAQSRARPRRV